MKHDTLAREQAIEGEVGALLALRHAALHYLVVGEDELVRSEIARQEAFSSSGARNFLFMYTGLDSKGEGLSTVGEIVKYELSRFREEGWEHPRLEGLLSLLSIDP